MKELDDLLQRSDPDSMDWADGGGHELATKLLGALGPEEWQALAATLERRDTRFRQCLAEALAPALGSEAKRLMLTMVRDADAEVAFVAASRLAFHCGVNDGPAGPFIDPTTRDESLLNEARSTCGLTDALRSVAASCDPRLQQRLQLLLALLSGRGRGRGRGKARASD